jgi:hypothetical protein
MKKKSRALALVLSIFGLMFLSNLGMAFIPEYAAWERLAQTFEEGHWIVDEECTGIGEVCLKDDIRSVIIYPE